MLLLAAALGAAASGSCTNADDAVCLDPRVSDVEVTAAPLFGAAPTSQLLELDAREQNAVVALVDDSLPGLCTGVLVAPTLVLTAAHCVSAFMQAAEVRVGADAAAPVWALTAARVDVHPALDLSVVWLARPVPRRLATALAPLRVPLDLVGQRAQLAGFGLTERRTSGRRMFTDEAVVDQDADHVTIDGEGQRGACLGDSGGPLLVRDALAQVRVAGVLSRGSPSCHGIDRYVLAHRASEWLDAAIGEACSDGRLASRR